MRDTDNERVSGTRHIVSGGIFPPDIQGGLRPASACKYGEFFPPFISSGEMRAIYRAAYTRRDPPYVYRVEFRPQIYIAGIRHIAIGRYPPCISGGTFQPDILGGYLQYGIVPPDTEPVSAVYILDGYLPCLYRPAYRV